MGEETVVIERSKEFGMLQQEVHTLTKSVNKLFEIIENNQPKSLSVASILGIVTSALGIVTIMFASVIYMINSSNAPINTQIAQLASVVQAQQTNAQQNNSLIQLTNKEVLAIKNRATGNESTLNWLLYDENIPKQLTQLQGRVDHLEELKGK